MKLEDFESSISTVIVQRGQSYFHSGQVKDLEETEEGFWQAYVLGSDEYEVEIELSGDEVKYYGCTCPYDMGPVCKHVVAVLMAVRKEKREETVLEGAVVNGTATAKSKPLSKSEQLQQTLGQLAREELEDIIRDLFAGDRHARNSFLLRYQHLTESAGDLAERYRDLFDGLLDQHSGGEYIDYGSAWDFCHGVADLLKSLRESNAAPAEQMDACFEIIEGIINEVLDGIDDSDGGLGMIGEQIYALLESTYPKLPHEQQQQCFKRTLDYHYGGLDDYGLDSLDSLLAQWAEGQVALQAIYLDLLDQQITQRSGWGSERKLRTKYDLLMQWQRLDEATELAAQHMEVAEFRKHFVQQARDQGETEKARQLIHEGIVIAEKERWSGVVTQWREMLLEIAEQANDLPAVRAELLRLLEDSRYRLELYKRYKATFPAEEWEALRHDFYQQIKGKGAHTDALAAILHEENELAALMDLLKNNKQYGSFRLIKQYMKPLATQFPEEITATYAKAIRSNMEQTGRSVYEQAAHDMQELAKLPGGKEVMQKLLVDFCVQYKNRRAMLEIFRRVFG